MEQIADLLDESISTEGYVIRPSAVEANYIDLSKIDFDLLRQQFNTGRKAIEAQKLRTQIAAKVAKMVQLNKTRMNFLEEFQRMIEEYNSGAANIETFFARLMAFTQKLSEDRRSRTHCTNRPCCGALLASIWAARRHRMRRRS